MSRERRRPQGTRPRRGRELTSEERIERAQIVINDLEELLNENIVIRTNGSYITELKALNICSDEEIDAYVRKIKRHNIEYYIANIDKLRQQKSLGNSYEDLLDGRIEDYNYHMSMQNQSIIFVDNDNEYYDWTKVDSSRIDIRGTLDYGKEIEEVHGLTTDGLVDFAYGPGCESILSIEWRKEWNEEEEAYVSYISFYLFMKEQNFKYADEQETLASFEGYKWSHGLAAYNSNSAVANALGVINNPNWEICCSFEEQQIGPIGFYVTGDCKVASNMDLMSFVENGRRAFDLDNVRSTYQIESPEEIDTSVWDHGEGIITNTKVVGVWVKSWYTNDPGSKKAIEKILEMTGLDEVTVVSNRK